MKIGMEKGAKMEAVNIARRALTCGVSLEDVMKMTGLTEEEINAPD
jgi:predicted transposase YdaD